MPFASSSRCSQKPSNPAYWMVTTPIGRWLARSARRFSFSSNPSSRAVAGSNIVARDPVSTRCPHGDKPTGSAQFQSHKEGGMLIRSGGRGWAEKVGARHRSPPRVGVSNRTLGNPAAAHPHRILSGAPMLGGAAWSVECFTSHACQAGHHDPSRTGVSACQVSGSRHLSPSLHVVIW